MQPPSASKVPAAVDPAEASRRRLVGGLLAALDEKGYAATTIADVVRHAGVSKRTFYEQFTDKEECFHAAFLSVTRETMRELLAAVLPDVPLEDQLRAVVHTYLHALEGRPVLTQTFHLEILAAGARALKLRRAAVQSYADLLRRLVDDARVERPELRALSPAMATAIAGGINELVLMAVEKGRATKLRELEETATELLERAVSEGGGHERGARRGR